MNIENVIEVHNIRGIKRKYITILLAVAEMVKKLGLAAIITVLGRI